MSAKISMSETENQHGAVQCKMYTMLYVDYTAMKTGARTEWENLWDKILS